MVRASVQPELGRIAYTGSDFPHPIWFYFPQEGPDDIVQNRPGSDLDGLVSFWPNASGPEANRCSRIVGPGTGRTQPARNQFPTFRLGSVLPQTARIHCVQTIPDPIWFWLTVSGFGPTVPVRKQAGVKESSGLVFSQCFRADSDRMQVGRILN